MPGVALHSLSLREGTASSHPSSSSGESIANRVRWVWPSGLESTALVTWATSALPGRLIRVPLQPGAQSGRADLALSAQSLASQHGVYQPGGHHGCLRDGLEPVRHQPPPDPLALCGRLGSAFVRSIGGSCSRPPRPKQPGASKGATTRFTALAY